MAQKQANTHIHSIKYRIDINPKGQTHSKSWLIGFGRGLCISVKNVTPNSTLHKNWWDWVLEVECKYQSKGHTQQKQKAHQMARQKETVGHALLAHPTSKTDGIGIWKRTLSKNWKKHTKQQKGIWLDLREDFNAIGHTQHPTALQGCSNINAKGHTKQHCLQKLIWLDLAHPTAKSVKIEV